MCILYMARASYSAKHRYILREPNEWGRGATTGQKLRGTIMASAGARAYMGVWGLCPQWGPGAKPLVGGQGAKPPEAEAYITIAGVNFCLKITAE
jgi:hypothetical protein